MNIARILSLLLPFAIGLSSASAQETEPDEVPATVDAESEAASEAEAEIEALEEALEAAAAEITAESPESDEAGDDDRPESRRDTQAPLMREGSRVEQVRGTVTRNPTTGLWQFTIPPRQGDGPALVLILMPCRLLEELEATVASAPDRDPTFLMTGRVYLFRQQNYLLPVHPPQLVGSSIASVRRSPSVTDSDGQRAADIIRSLDREVGPVVPRAPAVETTVVEARPEGTNIVERRGQVRRTRSGAYIFVFDADRFGLADPPLIMLPCELLDRFGPVDRGTRWREGSVLLTGEVLMYRGTRYVLPRAIRRARNVTLMNP